MRDRFSLCLWSLYCLLHLWGIDRRALAKTSGLPVSKTESSCLWFGEMESLRGCITDCCFDTAHPSAPEQEGIEFPDSLSVLLSICNTPLWVTLSMSLRPGNLISLHGHVFVFHTHWRGRFSRSYRWEKRWRCYLKNEKKASRENKKRTKEDSDFFHNFFHVWHFHIDI